MIKFSTYWVSQKKKYDVENYQLQMVQSLWEYDTEITLKNQSTAENWETKKYE